MDTVKFIEERNRMCRSFDAACHDAENQRCPASFTVNRNGLFCAVGKESTLDAKYQIDIVEKWSSEHPRKTRQDVFLEQWPNAACIDDILVFCPRCIDTCFSCLIDGNNNVDCATCRHEFWMQVVK